MNFLHLNNYNFNKSLKKQIIFLLCFVFIMNTNSEAANPTQNIKLSNDDNINYTLEQLKDDNLKIGLALSGGAAKGLAHIGVIKALEESGINIDYIAGSSMGALIGAAYASGIPIDTVAKIATNVDWKTTSKLLFPGFPSSGLVKGNKVKDFFYTIYGDKKIENLPIPFSATAADISTGSLYIINKGNLLEAVRASTSVPVIFTPVKYQDKFLVDGGLVNPVPIDIVREMGADFVIAVHVIHSALPSEEKEYIEIINSDQGKDKLFSLDNLTQKIEGFINKAKDDTSYIKPDKKIDPPKLRRISHNTFAISRDAIANLQIKFYKPELLIEPNTQDINIYEFHRGKDAIKIGYDEAMKVLDNLK